MVLGTLIGVIILIIAVVIGFSYFSDVAVDIIDQIGLFSERQGNIVKAQEGETVCDLRFTLFGAFDLAPPLEDFFFEDQRLYLGQSSPSQPFTDVFHPEIAQWNFRDCYTEGTGTLFNLAPQFHTERLDSGQVALNLGRFIADQNFKVELEFERDDGRVLRKVPSFTITEPAGTPLPFTFEKTFVFDNIPLDDYDVKITCSGDCQIVNLGEPNEAFIYNIIR